MTPLRRRMIEDLRIRGLAQNTIDSYVGAVERFARYFGRSPAELDREHIRAFQVHLVCERRISIGTLNSYTSALRFLYTITLGKDWDIRAIPYARIPKKLPEVLHQDEALRLFAGIANLKHRAIAMTIYAAGLRVSEVAHHKDYAAGARSRVMQLDAVEFVRRFLIHVLPRGFVRIRHYGLLANAVRRGNVALCRSLMSTTAAGQLPDIPTVCETVDATASNESCPKCSVGTMVRTQTFRPGALPARNVPEPEDSS